MYTYDIDRNVLTLLPRARPTDAERDALYQTIVADPRVPERAMVILDLRQMDVPSDLADVERRARKMVSGLGPKQIGTQANFRKKKPPVTYRFDSSLSPALEWDGKPGGREIGEWLIKVIEDAAKLDPPHVFSSPADFRDAGGQVVASVRSLAEAIDHLKRISTPFLNW